ncbi:MAG: hypothetical protein LBS50_08075 [Prevotellaceae bacterium]|jgi:hypothetical protein|nr:hypothetical protein [Prevotellaceae bacterium]
MKKTFFVIFFAVLALNLSAQTQKQFDNSYGKPLLILIETLPKERFISEPTFAFYENGQVIFQKIIDGKVRFFEFVNDREQTERLFLSMFYGIKEFDEMLNQKPAVFEQVRNIIFARLDTLREMHVYGNLRHDKEVRTNAPKDFLKLFDRILKYSNKKAYEWLPEYFEVLAAECIAPTKNFAKWNKNWGKFNGKRDETAYSIFVDRDYFKDFYKFFINLKEKPVEINGKLYYIEYRFPFPNLY